MKMNEWFWVSFQGIIAFSEDLEADRAKRNSCLSAHPTPLVNEETKGPLDSNSVKVSTGLSQTQTVQGRRGMEGGWPPSIPYVNCNPRYRLADPTKPGGNDIKCKLKIQFDRSFQFDQANQRWNWYKSWNLPSLHVRFFVSESSPNWCFRLTKWIHRDISLCAYQIICG